MKLTSALLPLLLAVQVLAQDPTPAPVQSEPVVVAPAPVAESVAPAGPTATDNKLKLTWNWLTDNGNAVHLLDNGTAASLYDFNKKEWLGGAMTALYSPKMTVKGVAMQPLSADLGVAQSLEQGRSAFPFLAVRFHGKELLAQSNDSIKAFFDNRQNLLRYLTLGGWAARDWNIGDYRYGGFMGAEAKFGN